MITKRPGDYESTPQREIADFEKCFGTLDASWDRAWKTWMTKVH
jgi:hypothetical protein